MSFTRPFLHGIVFFRTSLPCSGGYHMESDAVGMTPEKINSQVLSIWAKVCILMTVCVILLDMTTPPWWREIVMVYLFTIDISIGK